MIFVLPFTEVKVASGEPSSPTPSKECLKNIARSPSKLKCPLFTVAFDQSNEQVYSPFETGFSGLSELNILIRNLGGTAMLNSEPLSEFLPVFTKSSNPILLLGVSMFRQYPDKDIRAILNFVKKNGAVLVIFEHDNLMQNADFQNKLLAYFSIKALDVNARSHRKDTLNPLWLWAESPRWKFDKVQFPFPGIMETGGDVEILATISQPVKPEYSILAAADCSFGGPLVALGDQEIIWNGASILGIEVGQNREFMKKIFSLLSGIDLSVETTSCFSDGGTNTRSDKTDKLSALFVTDGYSLTPHSSRGSLNLLVTLLKQQNFDIIIGKENGRSYNNYDLVVIVNPLKKLKDRDAILKAKKLLLIGDGQSDFLGVHSDVNKYFNRLSEHPVQQTEYPLNALSTPLGLTFMMTTIVSTSSNHLEVDAKWVNGPEMRLQRATGIKIDKNKFKILAQSFPAWDLPCLTPEQNPNAPVDPFNEPEEKEQYSIIVSSDKVFGIGDMELIMNDSLITTAGKRLVRQLCKWVKKESSP